MKKSKPKAAISFLQEFSIPLMLGVVVALGFANIAPDTYHDLVHGSVMDYFVSHDEGHDSGHHADAGDHADFGGHADAGHGATSSHALADSSHGVHGGGENTAAERTHSDSKHASHSHGEHSETHADQHLVSTDGHESHSSWTHFFSMHFLVNELFMVFFFGIAAKEITEACLPGGSLNPVSKAINPLMGTIGGVIGPVATFLFLNWMMGEPAWANGWGIPTATDIALAWLAARCIFGAGHPAITFLLLLAVADDAIGLGIIAIAYPDPSHPTQWLNALWIIPGMISAFALRKFNIQSWLPYVAIGGAFCWWGLYSAHLHPALTLVFIVPFLPAPKRDHGLFVNTPENSDGSHDHAHGNSPLEKFEHDMKMFVDFGLFFFAFANAGVSFSGISGLTWILLSALIVGKCLGISLFSGLASLVGCKLPDGMNWRHLIVASLIAGIGLTVALFVSGQAFTDPLTQGAAKMGSLFSAFAFLAAYVAARMFGISGGKGEAVTTDASQTESPSETPTESIQETGQGESNLGNSNLGNSQQSDVQEQPVFPSVSTSGTSTVPMSSTFGEDTTV
jgi:NhaA family Na+:H+ antiporter